MKRSSIPLVLAAALASLAFQAPPPPGPVKSPSPAARPSPTPLPQLEGVVKGPDGKPVDKALVIARPVDLAMGEAPLSARTDAAGRFQIRLKKAGLLAVRVEAAGLAATRLEKVRPGTPLTISLGKGGTIEGMVRDSQNAPVAKARVVARDEAAFAGSVLAEPEAGLVRATSDAKGYFRLEGLGPGLHTVTARARGAGSARRGSVRVGSRVDLLLLPGGTVFGRVTGARGQPAAGAAVIVEREERLLMGGEQPVETTDAAGQFEILGLAPGTYSVIVRHQDYAPGVAAGIALDKEGSAKADIALSPGLRITGRLVGAEGRPVPGKVHVQEMEGRPAPRALTGWVRAEAGPDGRFDLPAVAGGSYVLAAVGSGHTPQRVEVSVPATGAAPVDVGDVMLEVGLAIRGRVRDKAGTGLAGATLRALPDRPFGAVLSINEGQSEADGGFVLAGLGEGTYRVTAHLSGYANGSQVASTGAEGLEIVLTPGGTITGQVVDENNRPIDSFNVDAEPSSRSGGGGFMFGGGRDRVVDPDGRFTLDGLAEGSFVVRAETPEMVAGSVSGVKVVSGQTTDVGRIRLSRGGIVRGSVVDSAGAPVPGATVSVRGVGNEMNFRDAASITTDGSGLFEARGVPLGKADVLASHPNYAAGRVSVEVEASKSTTDARVVLTQGGRIEGWARKRDGTPLAGRIQVMSAQMMGMDMASRPAMVTVGADGTFAVEHVPPGRQRVLLMQGTPNQMMSMMNKEVEVREGETATVELTSRNILVSGRVTRGGVPQPSVRVNMRVVGGGMMVISMGGAAAAPNPSSGPQRGTAVTRDDGSYELLLDDAGEASTRLESLDGKTSLLSRNDTIPDVDSHVLDFALTGVTLSGVVIDKVTEKGVDQARVTALPKGSPRGGLGTQTGPDGRFTLEVDPGETRLRAGAEGYAERVLDVSVGQAGLSDVRLDLAKGLAIEGRVVDAQGRAVPGIPLTATSAGPRESRSMEFAMGLADGSFRLEGLASKPHALLAGSARAGFAFRAMVTPGTKDIALTLQPGGKVRVRVLAPDGQTAERVLVSLQGVGGVPASMPMGSSMTDSQGIAELDLPAGAIELEARKGDLRARQTVNIGAGGAAAAELTLKAEASGPGRTP